MYIISKFWNQFLDLFELLTSDAFWLNLLGERAIAVVSRFSSNDTIRFYLYMTLLPSLYGVAEWMIKTIYQYQQDFFYVSVTVDEDEIIYTPIDDYVTKHFKGVASLKRVRGKTGYENPEDEISLNKIDYPFYTNTKSKTQGNTPLVNLVPEKGIEFKLRYKGYTISVKRNQESTSNAGKPQNFNQVPTRTINMIVIKMHSRDLNLLQSFIQEWVNIYYDLRKSKLIIYKSVSGHHWDDDTRWKEYGFKQVRPFSSLCMKKNEKETILKNILEFKKSKDWYGERGIPYRRGYLLYGPPGTGKTSFIQSLAGHIEMNVAMLNLGSFHRDEELSSTLGCIPKNTILVIEDVDHYSFDEGISQDNNDDKQNRKKNQSVSVSGILNAIDGVLGLEDLILFMTCNNENSIPPALLRPGRIDVKINMGYLDDYQTESIFWRFFCPQEENPKKDNHPKLQHTITTFIYRMHQQRHQISVEKNLPIIQVTPAELMNHLLYYSLEVGLCQNTQQSDSCYEAILENIPDFIRRIANDRIQAIEHEKRKNKEKETVHEKKSIPTPPLSPSTSKKIDESDSSSADKSKSNE